MSRSNPSSNIANPSVRWMEWSGSNGQVKYYNAATKEQETLTDPLTFILLDQLSVIKGWDGQSESSIYSNEIRNTGTDIFDVLSFKGGRIANGLYKDIKDRVNVKGGKFNVSLYVAVKIDGVLKICNLRLHGAALSAWMEFCKASKGGLYKGAIRIAGKEQGQKGSITYFVPVFELIVLSEESNNIAMALDIELQDYLNSRSNAKPEAPEVADTPTPTAASYGDNRKPESELNDDDLPF